MICGIGVDSVEIDRFAQWHTYSPHQLSRIFSVDEITYCLSSSAKSAERFAARFAAKEALIKALKTVGLQVTLLYICKHASVIKDQKNGNPFFMISNELAKQLRAKSSINLSLTHTQKYATAFVIVEQV